MSVFWNCNNCNDYTTLPGRDYKGNRICAQCVKKVIGDIISVDSNHRVVRKGEKFIPQYLPYFFRTFITRWMGGWKDYSGTELVADGHKKIHVVFRFDNPQDGIGFIHRNKM